MADITNTLRGGIIEVEDLEELYAIAEKKGEPIRELALAFTDPSGTTYIPKEKVLRKHGVTRNYVLAHERNIMKARELIEENPDLVDDIMDAVEIGDDQAVKPETIKYYNNVKRQEFINRAQLELETVTHELAQQDLAAGLFGPEPEDLLDLKSLLIPAKKAFRNPLSLLISDPAGEEEGWQEKYGRDEAGNLIVTDPEEREQNFRHWFGTSKVVDKGGNPLVMYHGTPKGGFSEFDPDREGEGGFNLYGKGSYFTENPEVASGYATDKGEVYPVHLSVKNPLDMEAKFNKSQWQKFENAMPKELQGFEEYKNEFTRSWAGHYKGPSSNDDMFALWSDYIHSSIYRIPGLKPSGTGPDQAWREALLKKGIKAMGHDGITHIGGEGTDGERHRVYIIFDPTQAKSVHNRGLYNPADPDILSKREKPKKSLKIPA